MSVGLCASLNTGFGCDVLILFFHFSSLFSNVLCTTTFPGWMKFIYPYIRWRQAQLEVGSSYLKLPVFVSVNPILRLTHTTTTTLLGLNSQLKGRGLTESSETDFIHKMSRHYSLLDSRIGRYVTLSLILCLFNSSLHA